MEKTKELNERIDDLEKIREITDDSELYAEDMRVQKEEAFKTIKKLKIELNRFKKNAPKKK